MVQRAFSSAERELWGYPWGLGGLKLSGGGEKEGRKRIVEGTTFPDFFADLVLLADNHLLGGLYKRGWAFSAVL